MLAAIFTAGFFIGMFNNGVIPEDVNTVIVGGSAIYMWFIGYERCQDAGIHGGWALFAPILLGMIVLGCFGSKTAEE